MLRLFLCACGHGFGPVALPAVIPLWFGVPETRERMASGAVAATQPAA